METPQTEKTADLCQWYNQLTEIVDIIEQNEQAVKTSVTSPQLEISDSETSFTSLTTVPPSKPSPNPPPRRRGKDITLLPKKKRIRTKNPNAKPRRPPRVSEKGTTSRKRKCASTTQLSRKKQSLPIAFASRLDALPIASTLATSTSRKNGFSSCTNFPPSFSFSLPSSNLGSNNSQSGNSSQVLNSFPTPPLYSDPILGPLPFSPNLLAVQTSSAFSNIISLDNLPPLEIPALCPASLPITIDFMSYLNEVYDKVYAQYVTGSNPMLQNIRSVLIKKLLFDYATLELETHLITDFESLNEVVNLVLRRSGLLT